MPRSVTSDADGLTAQRFEGKPLRQPDYSFRDVPKSNRDLSGSTLLHVSRREPFVDSMAEMLLLCKEVMRRQQQAGPCGDGSNNGGGSSSSRRPKVGKKRTAKPLSLEYMADRTDVDDPIFGYFVRTGAKGTSAPAERKASKQRQKQKQKQPQTQLLLPPDGSPSKFQPGMLQGFVTVTTFTNWQTTFRWDSMHDSAFSYDDAELSGQMANGERRYDEDGSLAEQMQATVRCGDPWNEGIVWPRIAEISLLGALGCGKTLISLVIEKLEGMAATASANYDFCVLQATENSIPFYESMGFVRVGAILEDENFQEKKTGNGGGSSGSSSSSKRRGGGGSSGSDDDAGNGLSASSSADGTGEDGCDTPLSAPPEAALRQQSSGGFSGLGLVETTPGVFSSPVVTYVVKKQWERIEEIAGRFKVDVYDIIFLNKEVYEGIVPRSWLKKGTQVYVPSETARRNAVSHAMRSRELDGESAAPLWYEAKENDTPRMISKMFGVDCADLIGANRERLPGLVGTSRLKQGTRVKVSRFDLHDDHHVPYVHWTFPDDTFESTGEPSYMMARKLDRRRGASAKARPVASSLAVPITEYSRVAPSEESSPSEPLEKAMEETTATDREGKACKKPAGGLPKEPVKPKRHLSAYMIFSCEQRESLKAEKPGLPMAELKKAISAKWKDLPGIEKSKYQAKHEAAKRNYQDAMEKYQNDLVKFREANPNWKDEKDQKNDKTQSLVNQVVKLNHKEERDAEFEYYYVLTYIPDLQWCHLAPMRKVACWGPDKQWRPIWMLVDEQEGKELDISSTFCEPVKARPWKNSVDADEEQWDILESRPMPPEFEAIPNYQNQNQLCGYASRAKPLAPIFFTSNGANTIMLGSNQHGKKRKRSSAPQETFEERSLVTDSGISVTISPTFLHQSSDASRKRRKKHRFSSPSELNSSCDSLSGRPKNIVLADGSIKPAQCPKLGPNGLFKKPRGRPKLGMDWDAARGLWVPSSSPPLRQPDAWKMKGGGIANLKVGDDASSHTADEVVYEDIPEPGCVCKDFLYYSTIDDETCGMVAKKLGCAWRNLANANKDRYGAIKEQSKFEERTLLRIPSMCGICGKLESMGNPPMLLCDRCGAACHLTCTHNKLSEVPRTAWFCQTCEATMNGVGYEPSEQCQKPGIGSLVHPTKKHAAVSQVGPTSESKPESVTPCETYQESKGGKEASESAYYHHDMDDTKSEKGISPRKPPHSVCTLQQLGKHNADASDVKQHHSVNIDDDGDNGKRGEEEDEETFHPGFVCKDMVYYCSLDDETCAMVADKLGCPSWRNLALANKERYGFIKANARFEEGTLLIIPKTHDVTKVQALCKQGETDPGKEGEAENFFPGFVCKDLLYYCTLDNETCGMVADKCGSCWRDMANANKDRYGAIKAQSKFKEGTVLRIPEKHDIARLRALYRHEDGEKLDYCCNCGELETHDGPLMILCDGCDAACHLKCTHDKLSEVPEEEWFCKTCAKKRKD